MSAAGYRVSSPIRFCLDKKQSPWQHRQTDAASGDLAMCVAKRAAVVAFALK